MPVFWYASNLMFKQGKVLERYYRLFMEKLFKMTLDYLQETLRDSKSIIRLSLLDELKKKVDFTIN
jgi:hypothetical protein